MFGALTFGAELTAARDPSTGTISVSASFDPITAQLDVGGDLFATVSLGMIDIEGRLDVALSGSFSFAYCDNCTDTVLIDLPDGTTAPSFDLPCNSSDCCEANSTYVSPRNTSNFYFNKRLGYDVSGELSLSVDGSGIAGLEEVGTGLTFGIADCDALDDSPPEVTLPDVQGGCFSSVAQLLDCFRRLTSFAMFVCSLSGLHQVLSSKCRKFPPGGRQCKSKARDFDSTNRF